MLLTRVDPSASQPPSTFAVMPGGTLSAFEHVEWVAPAVVKKQRKRLAVYTHVKFVMERLAGGYLTAA